MKFFTKPAVCLLCVALLFLSSCADGIIRPIGSPSDGDDGSSHAPAQTAAQTTAADTQTAATAPALPEEKTTLSFLGCGDNIVYYGNVREAAAVAIPGGRQYNFAPTYELVADYISSADISFINQETLMAGDGFEFTYYPTFNGPQDMGLDLVDVGFDVVSLANNHMLDKGGAGLAATIDFWQEQNVLMIGGYESAEDYNTVRFVEKEGVKIAFLAYTYGTNGIALGAGYELAIPYLDEETVKTQIEAANREADLVFVSVHWGQEYTFTPNDEQKNYASIMTEAGADVILGHHPHVIQPVEWLTAADGSRTLCVYSLGNFIGEQANDYNMVGGMISLDIVKQGDEAYVENPLFIPTVYYFNSSFYGNCVYPMEEFTEALAASHGISAYGKYTSLEKLRKYVTDTVDKEFLPESFR